MTTVQQNSHFALDLYGKLRANDGNLFFSPYSLSTALAMTYAGARGQTAEQMAEVLHFPFEQEPLHRAFADLIRELQGDGKPQGCQLDVANALWGQKGYGFLQSFLDLTQRFYDAALTEVDFALSAEAARQTINAWVEEQTQHQIKDLLKPGIVTELTRLVLSNAIYFKGSWASQFEKRETRREPFRVKADHQVPVPMMHQTGRFRHLKEDRFQALELPYAGGRLSMVVLLPRAQDGLAAFEQTLNVHKLETWLARLRERKVAVWLPRFKVTAEFVLNDVLAKMGMPLAFDALQADFSGMDGGKGPGLFISAIVHKAFVDVNEEGTEAAASTAVVMDLRGLVDEPPEFRADHPFVFLIRDLRTGSILFIGRVTEPVP